MFKNSHLMHIELAFFELGIQIVFFWFLKQNFKAFFILLHIFLYIKMLLVKLIIKLLNHTDDKCIDESTKHWTQNF
jgi:hypothetical protein